MHIDADYLVVGCGAAGMAFTDEILTHSDATVAMVDRRHAPGGHWVDAYPFVRLHQPSAFYGVSSMPLGTDHIDTTGLNEGFYELAGPAEICAYYDRVMHQRFLASGRVRFFPGCEYVGDHAFVSRLSGARHEVRVGRKLVDTAYMEGTIPATTPPPFEVADGVHCRPVGELPRLTEAPERFVIIGGGKTALDACVWLLLNGVDPDAIRWIKPREGWWLNRRFHQPLSLLPVFYQGTALQFQGMAEATSVDDFFHRLEAAGYYLRIDPSVEATMFRAAIVSEAELALLRQIKDVVRLGRVQRIEPDHIVLDEGRIPTTPGTVHVHCAAQALPFQATRPVFEADRITPQPLRWGFAPFQGALTGYVEATLDSDDEKNRLCPPMPNLDTKEAFLRGFLISMQGDAARMQHPEVRAWVRSTRLNPGSGVPAHREDPRMQDARATIRRCAGPALTNIQRLLAAHD